MIIIETLLLTVLLSICIYVTLTDFKTGLIPNKVLIVSGIAVLIMDIIYYSLFQNELLIGFLLNFAVTTFFSILLYIYSFWGAGDSKLMIFIGLAVPARFYSSDIYNIPMITIPVQTFAIAFLYLMLESIVLGIKNKNFFTTNRKITSSSLMMALKNYVLSYIYILLFSFIIRFISGNFIENNTYLIPLCNFFIVFTILNFNFFQKKYVAASVILIDIILMAAFRNTLTAFIPPLWNLLIIAIVIVFRRLAEKYNYKTIKTSDINSGMILSFETVMLFKSSRVKGLPHMTTEDFRSRLTDDEAAAVRRWENSQTGQHEISIVKKLPFAVFITIGIITFLGLRMWISC